MPMRILRLEVEGYKSLKHVVWEPGDLNVLIGPNCSGKSNLLRLLEMLSASAREELDEFIKNDGGIKPQLWDKRAKRIEIALTLGGPPVKGGIENEKPSHTLAYHIELSSPTKWNVHYVERESLTTHAEKPGGGQEPVQLLERAGSKVSHLSVDGKVASGGIGTEQETGLSIWKGNTNTDSRIRAFGDHLAGFSFYYDPDTGFGSPIRLPNITRYDQSLSPDGKNLINFLHTLYSENESFKERLDNIMQAAFPGDYVGLIFSPAAEQYIQMRIRWKNLEWPQPASALSDGVLKFLFLASAFADPKTPSLIAIDEPETGLHPGMFPIIAELAEEASERTQVVISTHSPEFLNAFDDITPTTTVFEWHDGETELRVLSDENLRYWLQDYKLGEMFRSGGLEAIE